MFPLDCIRMFSCFHFCCVFFVYCDVIVLIIRLGMSDFTFANVFEILNDHLQLPNGEDVLQSIEDDREQ